MKRSLLAVLFGKTVTALQKALGFSFISSNANVTDGVLEVYKPTDRLGDFTVSRGSVATRVNPQGLVETVGGENLITYSEDFSDASWVKGGNIGLTYNQGISPNGENNFTRLSVLTDGDSKITHSFASQTGIYSFSVYAKKGDSNFIYMFFGNNGGGAWFDLDLGIVSSYFIGTASIDYFGDGVYRCSVHSADAVAFTSVTMEVADTGSSVGTLGDNILVWGAQLEALPYATEYIKTEGAPASSYDIARIDYTNGVAELLTEPQSTNLITYSEDFSDSDWFKQGSSVVINDTTISPDGTLNASTLQNADGINISGSVLQRNITNPNETSITIYAKSLGSTKVGIGSRDGTSGLQTITSYTFTDSDWIRISHVGTLNGGQLFIGDTDGDIAIWGAQLEALPYATSYIKCEGSSTTRLADAITDGGNVNVINSEEGTMLFEGSALFDDGTTRAISLIKDGTNRITIRYGTPSNYFQFYYVASGTTTNSNLTLPFESTENVKIALRWNATHITYFINGVGYTPVALNSNLLANDLTYCSFNNFYAGEDFFGRTRALKVYDRALTDEELTTITT